MADEIEICNLTLIAIGVTTYLPTDGDGTIAGTTATSTAANLFKKLYPHDLNLLLRSHFWQFARGYAGLTQLSDGTGKDWVDEWRFSYTYPADCLRVRRFVNDLSDKSPLPYKFVIRNDGGTKVILSDYDEADAVIEYTQRLDDTDVALFIEPFKQALIHLMAMHARPALAKQNDKARDQVNDADLYRFWWGEAVADDSNESEERDDPDPSMIRERTG